MTLEEAIKRCEEVAEGLEAKLNIYESLDGDKSLCTDEAIQCRHYADDYRQLAKCLKELKHCYMFYYLFQNMAL